MWQLTSLFGQNNIAFDLPVFRYTFGFLSFRNEVLACVCSEIVEMPSWHCKFFQDPIHDSIVFFLLKNADMCYVFFRFRFVLEHSCETKYS